MFRPGARWRRIRANLPVAMEFARARPIARDRELRTLEPHRLPVAKRLKLAFVASRGEELHHSIPIVRVPSAREVFSRTLGKTGLIENDFRGATEFESRNRIETWIPIARAPSLYDALGGHEFDLPPFDHATEKAEGAAGLAAELRGMCIEKRLRNIGAEERHFLEEGGVCEHFVNFRSEDGHRDLLMNCFGVV